MTKKISGYSGLLLFLILIYACGSQKKLPLNTNQILSECCRFYSCRDTNFFILKPLYSYRAFYLLSFTKKIKSSHLTPQYLVFVDRDQIKINLNDTSYNSNKSMFLDFCKRTKIPLIDKRIILIKIKQIISYNESVFKLNTF